MNWELPFRPILPHPDLPQSFRDLVTYKDVELRIAMLLTELPPDQREKVLVTALHRSEIV